MSGPVYEDIGDWLKRHRREIGISQEELAARTSCSASTLRKIEAGERLPSRQIALLFAEFFGLPADERQAFVTFARTGAKGRTQPSNASAASHSPIPTQTQQKAQAPLRAAHLRQSNLSIPLILHRT